MTPTGHAALLTVTPRAGPLDQSTKDLVSSTSLLGLAILLGSVVPFVPTGKLVSGAAALVNYTLVSRLAVVPVSLVASVAGDTVLLIAGRAGRGRLQGRRRSGSRCSELRRPSRATPFMRRC